MAKGEGRLLLWRLARGIRADESKALDRGAHWVASRRGFLRIYEDRVQMGDWAIPQESIRKATLLDIGRGPLGGNLLTLETAEGPYSFGLMPRLAPHTLPFPHECRKAEVRSSPFSRVYRVALIIAFLTIWYLALTR